MKYVYYGIAAMVGSLITLFYMCLVISAGRADRMMEEEMRLGTENEGQGKDRPEDDKGWSCAGGPEQ